MHTNSQRNQELLYKTDIQNDKNEKLIIPSGPWEINGAPLPNDIQRSHYVLQGQYLDSIGRPLHPHAHKLLEKGTITGKGELHNWGINYAAHVILAGHNGSRHEFGMLHNHIDDSYSFPYYLADVEHSKMPVAAAKRAIATTLQLDVNGSPTSVYEGIFNDKRETIHAWVHTKALLYHLGELALYDNINHNEIITWVPTGELNAITMPKFDKQIAAAALRNTHA